MASLISLQTYQQLFTQIVSCMQYYTNNLRNEIFEQNDGETNNQAFQRGETIFDQSEENLRNLNEIIEKEQKIIEFFSLCKENKKRIIDYNNELISQMMTIKKKDSSKEEYIQIRNEWNKKRNETPDEKNRRECEEMLEEINDRINDLNIQKNEFKEERNKFMEEVEKMKQQQNEFNNQMEMMRKEREEMSVKKEFEEIANEYVKKSEFNDVASNYLTKNDYVKEMDNYVKKNDFENNMKEYSKKIDLDIDMDWCKQEKERIWKEEYERKRKIEEEFKKKYPIGSEWKVQTSSAKHTYHSGYYYTDHKTETRYTSLNGTYKIRHVWYNESNPNDYCIELDYYHYYKIYKNSSTRGDVVYSSYDEYFKVRPSDLKYQIK